MVVKSYVSHKDYDVMVALSKLSALAFAAIGKSQDATWKTNNKLPHGSCSSGGVSFKSKGIKTWLMSRPRK